MITCALAAGAMISMISGLSSAAAAGSGCAAGSGFASGLGAGAPATSASAAHSRVMYNVDLILYI